MKAKSTIIIVLLFLTISSYAQEMRTLFKESKSRTNTYGGYGGPLINSTQMNGEWGLMLGGRGGVLINHKIAFGGVGMGLVSDNVFVENDSEVNAAESLDLGFGAGGIFVEYIFKPDSPVHFSIPLNMMAGGVSVNDISSNTEIESSYVFIIEPGVNIEFHVANQFIPAINISYRQVIGSSLVNVSDKDLSGLSIGMVFKFGDF